MSESEDELLETLWGDRGLFDQISTAAKKAHNQALNENQPPLTTKPTPLMGNIVDLLWNEHGLLDHIDEALQTSLRPILERVWDTGFYAGEFAHPLSANPYREGDTNV